MTSNMEEQILRILNILRVRARQRVFIWAEYYLAGRLMRIESSEKCDD